MRTVPVNPHKKRDIYKEMPHRGLSNDLRASAKSLCVRVNLLNRALSGLRPFEALA